MGYREMMAEGDREYESALAALRDAGHSAEFTQTGGMCAALDVKLERGRLLVTEPSEELPWVRADQRGWGVGYYVDSEDASDGPLYYVDDHENASDARLVEPYASAWPAPPKASQQEGRSDVAAGGPRPWPARTEWETRTGRPWPARRRRRRLD